MPESNSDLVNVPDYAPQSKGGESEVDENVIDLDAEDDTQKPETEPDTKPKAPTEEKDADANDSEDGEWWQFKGKDW